jgi:hypothetical protein
MRYMLLIYASETDYSHMTSEEHAAIMQGHGTFAQEAMQRGILMGGAPLQPTSTARTGPFASAKAKRWLSTAHSPKRRNSLPVLTSSTARIWMKLSNWLQRYPMRSMAPSKFVPSWKCNPDKHIGVAVLIGSNWRPSSIASSWVSASAGEDYKRSRWKMSLVWLAMVEKCPSSG